MSDVIHGLALLFEHYGVTDRIKSGDGLEFVSTRVKQELLSNLVFSRVNEAAACLRYHAYRMVAIKIVDVK